MLVIVELLYDVMLQSSRSGAGEKRPGLWDRLLWVSGTQAGRGEAAWPPDGLAVPVVSVLVFIVELDRSWSDLLPGPDFFLHGPASTPPVPSRAFVLSNTYLSFYAILIGGRPPGCFPFPPLTRPAIRLHGLRSVRPLSLPWRCLWLLCLLVAANSDLWPTSASG